MPDLGHLPRERWLKGPRSPAHRDHKYPLLIQQYKNGETLEGHTSLENQLLPTDPMTSPSFPGQPWLSRVLWGEGSSACYGHNFKKRGPFSLFCFPFLY